MRPILVQEDTLPSHYPAICRQDYEGRWVIDFPDFPELCVVGAMSVAEVVEEATVRLADAIKRRRLDGKLFPYPSSLASLHDVAILVPVSPDCIGTGATMVENVEDG